jgi:hypothetical protein
VQLAEGKIAMTTTPEVQAVAGGPAAEAAEAAVKPAATAADALAVFRGEVTGPAADAVLASYFAPGPEPRYDTPARAAEAEAQL